MEEFLKKLIDMGSNYGGKILLAIAAAIAGLIAIKFIGKAVAKATDKTNGTQQLR